MLIIKNTVTLISFIFITFLIGCVKNVNMSTLLPVNNYLLVATSFDNSVEGAISKALSLLAQNIFVKVSTNFSSLNHLDVKGNFSSSTSNQINLNSTGYFKDIEYSEPEVIAKGKYKISVGLSTKSLLNTISYLHNSLKIPLVDTLPNSDLKEELSKTNFLISLIMYANSISINVKMVNLDDIIKYRYNLTLRLSDVSQITFNILPNLNNVAQVNINNKDYSTQEVIFLPPGLYYYTVYAKGYKTITNKLEVPSKDKLFISLYLQKLLSSPINVKLNITFENPELSNLFLKNKISTLLEKYQLNLTNFTTNILSIHFLPLSYSLISDYYFFNLPVEISLIKNETQNISKNFSITYVSSTVEGKVSTNTLIHKIDEFLAEITADNNLTTVYK